MAFTMPVLKNAKRWPLALMMGLCLAMASPVADAFEVESVEARFDDGLVIADARLRYALSEPARDALENGVPLVIEQRLVIERPRWWWRNVRVVERERRYQLQYHAMSRRFVLTWIGTGESRSFRSLDALLEELGRVEFWPLVRSERLDAEQVYQLAMETTLDLEALPRLLRTVTLTDGDWQLGSETRRVEVRR